MASFAQRISLLFAGTRSLAGLFAADPLNYDELVHLDAEELAEGGILRAYTALSPRLQRHAASPLIPVTEEMDNDLPCYIVHADGRSYRIYSGDDPHGESWERATVAFFDIVNDNLNGAAVRFYALYRGNDLSGMFLTQEQYAVARRVLRRASDWPWLPVDDAPRDAIPAHPDQQIGDSGIDQKRNTR